MAEQKNIRSFIKKWRERKGTSAAATATADKSPEQKRKSHSIEWEQHMFQVGKEFINYYRDPEDSTKVFIPADSISKITLLSPESAKNLMDGEG